jgi:p24 family protein beta-1
VNGNVIAVWIENLATGQKEWSSRSEAREDTFGVPVEAGAHVQLCFQSQFGANNNNNNNEQDEDDRTTTAELTQVRVGFGWRVHATALRTLPDDVPGPDAERALHVVQAALSIETQWDNLADHFEYLRSREAAHLKVTQEILGRIMKWTIVEAVVVVVMAVAQVMYWRKFFEQKRYL